MKSSTTVFSVLLTALSFTTARAQGTYRAASCNYSDVNAIINGPTHSAVNGDTINVPGGSCTWSQGITVPSNVGISIIGAGSASTIITDSIAGAPLLLARPTYGNSTMRISGFTFSPQSGTTTGTPIQLIGTCTASGCPNIRFDNNVFTSTWPQAGLNAYALIFATNVFGVMDHNTLNAVAPSAEEMVNVNHAGYMGTGQLGDNSWASVPSFGTENNLYVEDNTFGAGTFATDCDHSDTVADVGGCRFVGRFNTFNEPITGAPFQNHGTESTGRPRGGYSMEVYGNQFICSGNCPAMIGIRSGTALIYNNTFTYNSGVSASGYVGMSNYRSAQAFSPWGTCDGSSPYDQNDFAVYASGTHTGSSGSASLVDGTKTWNANQWQNLAGSPYSLRNTTQGWGGEIASNTANTITFNARPFINWGNQGGGFVTWNTGDSYQILRATVCLDQPGRAGSSILLSGNTPSPLQWPGDTLAPIYEWGDIKAGTWGGVPGNGPIYSGSLHVIHNRDFYYENFNQAPQSSPTSPFDGTTAIGMGHGTFANRPPACTTGVGYWATDQITLYKCTATNIWTSYYTPYMYPHPLVQGIVPPSQTSLTPATGVVATAR